MRTPSTSVEARQSQWSIDPSVKLAGFGFLLGWHFIILFYPLQPTSAAPVSEFIIARQIALNASLFACFALFGRLFAHLPQRDDIRSHKIVISSVIIGVIGSIGVVFGSSIGLLLTIASVTLIGAAEAAMTLLWLRFFCETSKNYSGRSLGASAFISSFVFFFVYHLPFAVNLVILPILPIISGVLLVVFTKGVPLRKNDPSGSGLADWDSAKRPFCRTTALLATLAFFFGLAQGCIGAGYTLLPVAETTSIFGAGVAGIVVFAIYTKSEFLPNLNPVINTSLLMFLGGIVLIPFQSEALSTLSAFLIMTGFIFFFVLALVFIIDLTRTFDLNLTMVLGANQALEYLMFTIAIPIGFTIWNDFSDRSVISLSISAVATLSVIAVILLFEAERPPWRADYYKHEDSSKSSEPDGSDNADTILVDPLTTICDECRLTPREREVFGLLAKGRNAEYIQNALVISNHTVKTHIYNVYRKLDVHSLQELLDLIDVERERINPPV